ncbi:MAG TPA: hypothetical protein VGX23_18920 [Actinocrinis sp.]|nr:hypothetical protein [Actinocrinis sp.]
MRGVVVAVCASAQATEEAAAVEADLVGRGAIVLGPAPEEVGVGDSRHLGTLAGYDRLRIEIAERVVVVHADGRVDEACADQISYALRIECPVDFHSPVVRMHLAADLYDAVTRGDPGRKSVDVRLADAPRESLGPGTLITFAQRDPGHEGTLLCRVARIDHFADRSGLVAAVDPGAVLPGADRAGLAAQLEEIYPGAGDRAHLAIHVQYLGQVDPQATRQTTWGRAQEKSTWRAAVLVTNLDRDVLLVKEAGHLDWRLPGHSPVTPADVNLAVVRALTRDVGPAADKIFPARLLVNDLLRSARGWEFELVLDGGVVTGEQAGAITTGPVVQDGNEVECRAFVAVDQIGALLAPGLARRVTGAHRRLLSENAPGRLSHGYAPGTRPVCTWHEDVAVPDGVPVGKVALFAFDPDDGRVLLHHHMYQHRYALPAARPEPEEGGQLLTTATRAAYEQAQIVIEDAILLGYLYTRNDPAHPGGLVQVFYAAPIVRYEQADPHQDLRHEVTCPPYRRFLCDPRRAADLLDDGPTGFVRAAAAARAAAVFRIPAGSSAPDGYLDHAYTPIRSTGRP